MADGFGGAGLRLLRRLLPRWRTIEAEVGDEVAFHVDRRVDELIATGQTPAEAKRLALAEFGDVGLARAELAAIDRGLGNRERNRARCLDLLDDARFAFRHLRRHPGYAIATSLVLALGFGASTATFGILHDAVLEPLPYRDSDRLVHLFETQPGLLGGTSEASFPDFIDWREQSKSFAGLEGYDPTNVTVREQGGSAMLRGVRVTSGFLDLLGVDPVLGRGLRKGEDLPGGSPVVLISHRYWRERFGSDPKALDSSLTIDQAPVRIVGVLPVGFRFAPVEPADFWFPLDADAGRRSRRSNHWLNVIGRLAPASTPTTALADLNTVMGRLSTSYPESNQGRSAVLVGLQTEFLGTVKPAVLIVFGAGALLLLVTIGNVASLLVARGLGRQREFQIRVAVGAGRSRLVRQLAIESLGLAGVGGGLGLVVAAGVRMAMASALPSDLVARIPALDPHRIDGVMVAFAVGAAFLAALLFALFPVTRLHQATIAIGPRTTTTRSGHRIRHGLVAGQLALVTILLGGIGLLARSVRHLLDEPLGFRPEGVVTARVALSGAEYRTDAAQIRFFSTLLDRIAALPGLEPAAVGAVTNLPLRAGGTNTFRVDGDAEPAPTARPEATVRTVAGGYFGVMGIPLVEGRAFSDRDDSTASLAVIVNASMAQRLGAGRSLVGRRLRFYAFPEPAWEVIGVVGDVRTGKLDDPPPPTVYFSYRQVAENRMSVTIRTAATDPLPFVRQVVASIDPSAAVYDLGTLSRLVEASPALAIRRVILVTLTVLGTVALALGVVGLFGVVAGVVAERTREFGIRQALGAAPPQIQALVLRLGFSLGIVGVGSGLLLFQLAARTLPGLFYRVAPSDPITQGAVAVGLLVLVLAASYIPSRRAVRVDPAITLRAE